MPPPTYVWVLNLDAELELASPSYSPAARVLEQQARFGRDSEALVGRTGLLLGRLPPGQPQSGLLGRAWSPTPRALAALRAAGITPEPHPSAEVLRRVNHRAFAHELGRGLPGQALVHNEAELHERLAGADGPWLLKRPLAFAGRGQRRLRGPIDPDARAWISASLRADALIVEPLVEPLVELSLHGFLWPDGRRAAGRVCVQTVNAQGVFRGVRLALDEELRADERSALQAAAEATAVALAKAGYFGPFGIDAYRYRSLDGSPQESFCALSEINARYTMGFATGFPIPPSDLHLVPT